MKTKKIILIILSILPMILMPIFCDTNENVRHWLGWFALGMLFSVVLFLFLGQTIFWVFGGKSFPEEVF